MVRTSQTATASHPVWDEQIFLDHDGKQAKRLRWSFQDLSSDADRTEAPAFAFQIYSTLQLEGDLDNLIDYLGREIVSDGFYPAWEVYDVQADEFACVEHQRREIAHRKRISSSPSPSPTSSPSPLIPKITLAAHDHRRYGFLIVIASDSYRAGVASYDYIDPAGPLWVHFDRRFSQKSIVETISRLEIEPGMAESLGVALDEIVVLPEMLVMLARRIQNTRAMLISLGTIYGMSMRDDGSADYGLDEDEGRSADQMKAAKCPVPGAYEESLQEFQVTSGPGDAVTVISNQHVSSESDLRYLIHIPFLSYSSTNSTLESVAEAFTFSIISFLPAGKTVHFEFHKSPSASLSTIVSFHRSQLSARPDFNLGALSLMEGCGARVYPCTRNEHQTSYPPIEQYQTFVVVLDKANFVNAQGVLFVMTDRVKLKPLIGEDRTEDLVWDASTGDYDETLVLRSASMEGVARRLGMTVLFD
ncbi:MAG: hypothetical protein M1818_000021 [Claussenomyces sp. TS43310]|nr:MAG: hypothetical protein M1818_000021 [Claussenomyces sp. TS43310]